MFSLFDYLTHFNNIGLSAADDKRYVLENGIDCVALGHYSFEINETLFDYKLFFYENNIVMKFPLSMVHSSS